MNIVRKNSISNKDKNGRKNYYFIYFVKKIIPKITFSMILEVFTVKSQKHFYIICEKNESSLKVF